MKIGVIHHAFSGYEYKRFVDEIKQKNLVKIFPANVCLILGKNLDLLENRKSLNLDVVVPRMSDEYLNFGLILIQHLARMGVPLVNNYNCIVNCKNKYFVDLCLKKKKIPQPKSAVALSCSEMLKHIKKMPKPVVLKLLDYSFGIGVARINDNVEAGDWFETIKHFNQPIYIQEYINHPGEDYRLFVVGNKVVGAMKRTARKGWKSNFSLGGKVENFVPNKEMKEIAIKSCEAVKGDVVGVDIMLNCGKPEVIEVNCFPGFRGLEKATGKNICKEIVKFAKRKARR